jgi:hypothetical protein
MLALAAPVAQNFTIYELNSEYITQEVTANTVVISRFEQGDLDISGVAGRVGNAYIRLPFPVKVALFPIPTTLQILLPFDFWSGQFLEDHFAVFLFRNMNLAWLLIVAPWFVFTLLNVKRLPSPLIRRLTWSGIAYYCAVAVIYGGLIPRYGTPTLFFIYPAIGYFWAKARETVEDQARAGRFFMHYYAFFTVAALGYLGLQMMRG